MSGKGFLKYILIDVKHKITHYLGTTRKNLFFINILLFLKLKRLNFCGSSELNGSKSMQKV
jgi:hypothetical protein